MYDMTQQRLPAPYELNSQMNQSHQMNQSQMPQMNQMSQTDSPQSFARGGRAHKHKNMTKVHMNPHELSVLDHLQGMSEYGPEGIKSYPHLEELLKNPHIVERVHHHARQHHASGGLTPADEHMMHEGRHGDSALAWIGPHTQHVFNEIAGHPTRNPYTGHPEYFSIKGALSGLWNTIKGAAPAVWGGMKHVARAAAPAIMPMVQGALGGRFGPAGQFAGNLLSQGVQSALGPSSQNANPMYSSLGQGLGRAAQSYGRNSNPGQAFGQGLQHFGSQMGGGLGGALSRTGQSLGQGRGLMESARSGAEHGFNQLGGKEGLMGAAQHVGQGLMQGGFGGARDRLNQVGQQFAHKMLPQAANQLLPHEQMLHEQEPHPLYG